MYLNLDRLRRKFAATAGRTLELLHLRLRDELLASGIPLDRLRLGTLAVTAIRVDLRVMSDEAAAEKIAGALYAARHICYQEKQPGKTNHAHPQRRVSKI